MILIERRWGAFFIMVVHASSYAAALSSSLGICSCITRCRRWTPTLSLNWAILLARSVAPAACDSTYEGWEMSKFRKKIGAQRDSLYLQELCWSREIRG